MKQQDILIIFILLLSSISYSKVYVISEDNPGYNDYLLQQKKIERNNFLYNVLDEKEEQLREEKKIKKNWLRIVRGKIFYRYSEELDKPEHYSIYFRYYNDDSSDDFTAIKYR